MTVARLRGEMYVTSKSVSDETDAEPVVREGTCIGRVASPVEDSTSTMLAYLSEDERHGLHLSRLDRPLGEDVIRGVSPCEMHEMYGPGQ